MTSPNFTLISHLGVKYWDTNLKFGMLTTHTLVLYIYYGFLKIVKILDFRALLPEKHVFWNFGSQNPKLLKIWDSHLVENLISDLFTPVLRSASVCIDLRSIMTTIFGSKSHDMTSLKRHFLQNVPAEFYKIFRHGVKLMSDKVLKVKWRYLAYLSSNSEYSRGGQKIPPQRGAG